MITDTSEKGLEGLIVRSMTGRIDLLSPPYVPSETSTPVAGGTGWILGDPKNYDRGACIDLVQLRGFVMATQPALVEKLSLETDTPTRRQFLARLEKEVGKRGVIDVLRKGLDHGPVHVDLFYGTPSPGNDKAAERFACNRFSVTRQLAYSRDETRRALDLGLFINGLPIATFELKNSLTKQTVEDAVEQYRRDRDPREPLFAFGRCVVHLAVDDSEVRFCTELRGKGSWFLPFNKGYNDGAGNPPNPNGLKTSYLWEEVLTPRGLTDILENYAQIVEETDRRSGKKKQKQVFPRFHQLDVVRRLLDDARKVGAGRRYLVQHSAGSGKSNSIAWLAHQLIAVKQSDGKDTFDSIIVVTDRRILDEQIQANIKQFAQVSAVVGAVTGSGASKTQQLSKFLESGKKIIISTVQTFPFLLNEIGDAHRGRRFAIIIDEAHSSQGGRTASAMSEALAETTDDPEDVVNDELQRRMGARKMLTNASYFAFTATPKNKTLEIFGDALPPDAEGKVQHRPFHSYTMKQAVQEGFILDVLKSYTPVNSYYKLVKTIEGDPEFDVKKAQKKLRRYVESHETAIRLKAEIMADHFHEQVIALGKIKGQARSMVVTNGIARAVQYYTAFKDYLAERKSPYRAIVAFSGEHDFGGGKVTESSLNGFPSSEIPDRIQEDPYRFLICADKFQTGYDEPLLHTMYVDKGLSGIKAVQTLSRLNRAHPDKHDVFVLDFQNDVDGITRSFADYYRTTVLSEETDPNKLHDLKSGLDGWQVYSPEQVEQVSSLFLAGAQRDQLDPILDACVAVYLARLDEDGQVDFKGKAKAFTRTYDFLASILPYSNPGWEKLSILLNFLIPKLPAPKEEDLSKGILESIDMDSYRVEKQALHKLQLPDDEAVIDPVPVAGGGRKAEPELDRLSNILKSFNEQFGTLFEDADRVARRLREDIAPKVAADAAYQNAKLNTPQTARIEHDKALSKVMLELLKDDTEVYKQFAQNPSFKRFVTDMVFGLTSGSVTSTTVKRPSSRPPGKHQPLEERLAQSSNARDRVGAVLLGQLQRSRRVTLGDAIRAAEKLGLSDDDALAAVERLARPQTASLQRFYVDRSGDQARIVSTDEVRRRSAEATDNRREWTSAVEVVWAVNETDAIAGGST
ncbi:type I restriction endonuclease subunit R [Corallococcus sp. AB045]|uniref:type I restriction endonuclease subunit R n=1 Tax=Corallococcus sp. AB045 TaxID=2316719 RepID=UPI000EBC0FB8|nr:type I restriction endonuclease subunit R [Corallococcus sp. AB045]RKH91907.1 type I restriction endonuclease subunit R [Corallococcus sp. AB045]